MQAFVGDRCVKLLGQARAWIARRRYVQQPGSKTESVRRDQTASVTGVHG
jgi:hypothetical protein